MQHEDDQWVETCCCKTVISKYISSCVDRIHRYNPDCYW